MSEDYAKWEAVGGSVYVEGFGGAFVCDCSDGTYGVDVGPAVAELIAREHNSLPSLRDQLRDKDRVIAEMQAQMRIVQRAHARQRENLGADILMLKALYEAMRPILQGLVDGKIRLRQHTGEENREILDLAEKIREAIIRADSVDLYYTPTEKIMREGFYGFYAGRYPAASNHYWAWRQAQEHEKWSERAQGQAGDNRPSEPAFGSMAHPPEGAQPTEEDGA